MFFWVIIFAFIGFVVWLNTSQQGKRLIQRQQNKIAEDKAKRKAEWQKIKDNAKKDFQPIKEEWNAQIAQDKENFKKTISSVFKKKVTNITY